MVQIIKETDRNTRLGKVKVAVIRSVDTYKEAIELVDKLNSKNTNQSVKYYTGNTIYR